MERRSRATTSDDDNLSNSDPDASRDDDGCPSEDEQHRLGARKNIPWDEIEDSACGYIRKREKLRIGSSSS